MTAPDTGLNFGVLFDKHGQESEMLPAGVYDAVVEEASVKSSKDASKPQIVVKFKIVDHPNQSGRKITNTFTVTANSDGAMAAFFRQMAALGFDGKFWAANPVNPLPTMAAQVIGRRARISVKHEPWQGVDRPKVGNVMPASGISAGGGLPPAPGMSGFGSLPVSSPPIAPSVPAAPVAPIAPVSDPAPAVAGVVAVTTSEPAPTQHQDTPAPAPAPEHVPAPVPTDAPVTHAPPAVPF